MTSISLLGHREIVISLNPRSYSKTNISTSFWLKGLFTCILIHMLQSAQYLRLRVSGWWSRCLESNFWVILIQEPLVLSGLNEWLRLIRNGSRYICLWWIPYKRLAIKGVFLLVLWPLSKKGDFSENQFNKIFRIWKVIIVVTRAFSNNAISVQLIR